MPQLDFTQWPGEIVWALAIFGVLYFVFARIFLPRISGGIGEREDRIAGEIGEARRMRDEARAKAEAAAGEVAAARARARAVAKTAADAAEAAAAKARAEADARLAVALGQAEERIAAARAAAMSSVRSIAGEAAAAMVARLSGAPVSEDALKRGFAAAENA